MPIQICRGCLHVFIGKDKGDHDMARLGYRSCALARNEVERATYVSGGLRCLWPERLKQ